MDSKHLEELTKTIAERNGTTPEAVRREMEAARNSAWDTDDSSARGRQKVLFPAGKPQLSEFLEVIAKKSKKHNVSFLIKRAPRTFRCGALSALLRLCRLFVQLGKLAQVLVAVLRGVGCLVEQHLRTLGEGALQAAVTRLALNEFLVVRRRRFAVDGERVLALGLLRGSKRNMFQ